jgi:DNA-binding HxlR family transcriptional regulator
MERIIECLIERLIVRFNELSNRPNETRPVANRTAYQRLNELINERLIERINEWIN